jgi:phosphatidylethanolamine-binding protein (PEBP) family uncharacterized protein
MRSTKLSAAIVLTLAMAGGFACSSDSDNGGTGGSSGSGGSGGSAGRGGSGGSSSSGGTTGGSSSTGGTTGGSSSTGGTGGSTGGTGGSTGGTGGSTGGTGGSTGGTGGSTGGTGGTGGSTGGTGGSSDGGKMDTMTDGSGGMEAGGGGAFALNVTGVETRNGRRFFVRGQTNGTGNMSPGFEWGPHPEAKSYVLSMIDMSNGGTHWLMYDIPPTVTKIPPALMRPNTLMVPEVPGAKHTRFSGGNPFGYFGPGAGSCNRYHFVIHAMKAETLPAMGDKNAIRTATFSMANRIAATTCIEVIGNNSAGMCN